MFNLLHLKYFFDTVRLNSVSRAASANFVTQSAVSQGLKKLESQLGAALLTHRRKAIKVTEEGLKVFERSQRLFAEVESLTRDIKEEETGPSGPLRFTAAHSVILSLLPEVLKNLKLEAPSLIPQLRPGHTGLVKRWLHERIIEFGVVLDNDDLSGLDCIPLFEGHFRLFESNQNPPSEPSNGILAGEPRAELHALQRSSHQILGHELQVSMQISSWEVIADLTVRGLGPGFFPDYLAIIPERQGILRPCNWGLPGIPYRLFLVHPAREQLSRGALLFLRVFREHLECWSQSLTSSV